MAAESQLPGGRERILAAAIEILETQSEAAIRFNEVAALAGVTPGVITYHFGSREKLVAEVHTKRFAGLVSTDLQAVRGLLDSADDAEGLFEGISRLTIEVIDAARAELRMRRLVSIAAIHGRPGLGDRVSSRATQLLDGFTELIAEGQSRGFFDASFEPRALATLVQAYALGMVVGDLDQRPVPRGEIAALVDRLLWSLRGPTGMPAVG